MTIPTVNNLRLETAIKLSASILTNIQMRNDFNFIVGESRPYYSSFIADFVSSKLAQLHAVDPRINNIVLSAEDRRGNFDLFLSLSLGRGQSIRITFENRNLFLSSSLELGNQELSFLLLNSPSAEKEITRPTFFCASMIGVASTSNQIFNWISLERLHLLVNSPSAEKEIRRERFVNCWTRDRLHCHSVSFVENHEFVNASRN
jgi:hypothetical protein